MLFVCSICGETFPGYGANPDPVTLGDDDQCCDACDSTAVVPERRARVNAGLSPYAEEWEYPAASRPRGIKL